MYRINREFEIERRKRIEWNRGYGDLLCVNIADAGSCVILAALRKEISLIPQAVEVGIDLSIPVLKFRPVKDLTDESTRFNNYKYGKSFSITAKLGRQFNDLVKKRLEKEKGNGFIKVNEVTVVYQVIEEDGWYVVRPFK